MQTFDFKKYHNENPHMWEKFEELALKAARYRTHFSARTIIHIIRWDTMLTGSGDYKISDHASTYYARLFIDKYPQHENFFHIKSTSNAWKIALDEVLY